MKGLLVFALFAGSVFGQVNVNVGSVTVPTEVSVAIETSRLRTWTPFSTTMVGAVNSSATSITVTDASGISVNDQIVIDTEALNVSAKAGAVLTVTRGATITTAAAHLNGAAVHVTQIPTIGRLFKEFIKTGALQYMQGNPPATIATQDAAITAAQAAKDAFNATIVQ